MNNTYILGKNLYVESSLMLDPVLLTSLEQALVFVQQRLQAFAIEPDFAHKMALAFGEGVEVNSLRAAWLTGDFSIFPEIQIRNLAELNGANGAYSAANNRIYLSWEFLLGNQGNIEIFGGLLLEEFGHRVDSLLNTQDSAGDEGAIFSALVQGESFSSQQLQQLKAEDDKAVITLNGQVIHVEQQQQIITVTNTNDSGVGSLRWAIEQANSTSLVDRIVFNIGDGGVQTIRPLSALPTIAEAVTIDGTTQPGYSGTPLIELNGSQAGTDAVGLAISAGNSTVKRLVINRFQTGIVLQDNGNNTIEGNYIGTDATGTVALANNAGIGIFGGLNNNNIIRDNLISGNIGTAVSVFDGTGNQVLNNLIGTNVTGTVALPNGDDGVDLPGAINTIVRGNTIAGNLSTGIVLRGSQGTVVENNFIGTDSSGTVNLGNQDRGVSDENGATNATIRNNTIAFNKFQGVLLRGTGNRLESNRIYGNSGLGIDLGGDGVTPNDQGDTDTGANNLQNYPIITSVTTNSNETTIKGILNSKPNQTYRIELFANDSADPSGYGEGKTYLDFVEVTTDNNGNASFSVSLSTQVPVGAVVAATATDPQGNTSEFSAVQTVIASPGVLQFSSFQFTVNEDGTAVTDIIVTRTGGSKGIVSTTISFADGTATGCVCAANSVNNDFYNGTFTVTLADGETSKLVPVQLASLGGSNAIRIRNDAKIEGNETFTINLINPTGGATIGNQGSATVTIIDDDILPKLTVTFNPNIIAENSGNNAATGTVTRDVVTDTPLVINLTSSDTTEATVPQQVTIAAGQASAIFSINAVDDAVVDGTQTVNITATPLNPETNIPLNDGAGSGTLQVTDNESPSLTLTLDKNIISETGTATATITRNFVTDQDLVVTLTNSDTSEATVPNTVTIAANQASANFIVTGIRDGETDGLQTVEITVSADGFNSIVTPINVSDVDVPDLVVSQISTPSGFIKESATIIYRVENKGLKNASGTWVDRVYLSTDNRLSADDKLIAENPFEGTVAVNSGYEKSVSLTLPDKPGKYYLIAATDSNAQVNEGGSTAESNNTTVSVPFEAMATYSATVSTDVETEVAGKPINLQGRAISNIDGSPVAFAPVTVIIENNGFRRELGAITNAQGNFQTFFTPLLGEGGTYKVNATYQGYSQEDSAPEDQFNILGMGFEPTRISHNIFAGLPFTEGVSLENFSDIPLSSITAKVEGAPDNWTVQVEVLPNLSGNGENELFYTILAPDESVVQDNFNIRLSSGEGVTAILPVTINLARPLPRLVANTNLIQGGVVRGNQASVDVQITNQGLSAVQDVDVLLPNLPWLSLASPSKIPFLARGESTTLTFLLTPGEDLPLSLYEGTIVLDAPGDSADLTLPFQFRTLSEAVGDLRVDVVDEYTFYVEGRPQVDEAEVRLINPFTNQVVSQFITNETGEVFFDDVKQGRYYLQIMADGHQSSFSTVDIKSGVETEKEIFLQREFVRYRWVVQPTEIQDRYTFTLETVFEANVPAPVVTIDPQVYDLSQLTESVNIINYTVANHGLIAAENFQLNFADHPLWEVDPLIDKIDILAPNSFVTIPVKITKLGSLAGNSTIFSTLEPSIGFSDTALSSYINQTELTNNTLSSLEPTVIIPEHFATSVLLPATTTSFQPVLELSNTTSSANLQLVSVQEGNEGTNNTVQIKIKRESLLDISLDQTVEVDYQTKPLTTIKNLATATSGLDYEAVAGTLVFAPGETEKFIDIKILGDNLIESSYYESSYSYDINNQLSNIDSGDFEQFKVELSNARYTSGQGEIVISDPIGAIVEIKDDDVYPVDIVEVNGEERVVFNDVAPNFVKSQIAPQLLDEIERSYKQDVWSPINIFPDPLYDSKLGFFRAYGTTIGQLVEDYLNSTKENPIHQLPIVFTHRIDDQGNDHYKSSKSGYDAREIIEGISNNTILGFPISSIAGFRNQAITKNYVSAIKNKLDSIIRRGVIPDGTDSYDIQSKSDLLKLGFSEQEATEFLYYVTPNYSSKGEQDFYDKYGNTIRSQTLSISSSNIFNLDYTPKTWGTILNPYQPGISIPELIAGGIGSSNYPNSQPRLDTRKLTGIVTVTKKKETQFPFPCLTDQTEEVTLDVKYNDFEITIEDGFDFAPGNIGSPFAARLTLPLQQLEVNNRAFDVPFKVVFQVDLKPKKYVSEPSNIPGEGDYTYDCGGERSGQDDVVLSNAGSNGGSGQSEPSCNIVPSSYSPSAGIRPIEYIQNICSPTTASANSSSLSLSSDNSVCARVTVRFSQDAAMTRSAFLGTLILENGRETTDLENVSITLDIRDAEGNSVNNLFGITPPLLSGLTGVDGTGILKAKSSGKAEFTIIPTNNAAPKEQTIYTIRGTLSYKDSGQQVTVPLAAVPITILPQAELSLDYFQQRDVFADDPFTATIEPSLPFSLGLIVKNSGKGAANNLQIQSAQPKIVDNEKGLRIDFKLIGTQLGTVSLSPELNLTIGSIDPGKTRVAQWQFTSSLQGKFIDYKASFEHINDLGLPELSLVKETKIHELIQKVAADGDNLPDFLVNDIQDAKFYPDTLYFSNGTTAPVTTIDTATVDAPITIFDLEAQITATAGQGWTYITLEDPADGQFQIKQLLRSDGTLINLDNIWRTDRTFPATGRPVYENILHFLDKDSTGSYKIIYNSNDNAAPQVREIVDVSPNPRNTVVDSLTVVFSESIRANTFNYQDLSLTLDGGANLITNGVTISQIDPNTFQINNLTGITGNIGQYQLSVNATGIQDLAGNAGAGIVNETWTFTGDRPAIASIVGFNSTLLNTAVNTFDVTFTEAINPSSFDYTDITLRRNNGESLVNNTVTITPIDATTFRVGNFAPFTNIQGDYQLLVTANGVQDTDGNNGVGGKGFNWVLDTTIPTLTSITNLTSPRNTAVTSVEISFSEAINKDTLNFNDLILTRDGSANLITNGVTLEKRNETTYTIKGLSGLQTDNGIYTLTVNGTGIQDAAGNSVSNSLTQTWTLDSIAPNIPTNIQVTATPTAELQTASLGILNQFGQFRVNSQNITITGNLPESNLRVYIKDLTTNQDLGQANVTGTQFSGKIQLPSPGSRNLEIRVQERCRRKHFYCYSWRFC